MKAKEVLLAAGFTVALLSAGCGGGGEQPSEAASGGEAPAAETAQVDPETAGKIVGKVIFAGEAPAPQPVQMDADPYCAEQHPEGYTPEPMVGEDGSLKNAVVYVDTGLENLSFPPPSEAAVLDQKGCWYEPFVVAVQAGQKLTIRNSDNTMHNVNTMQAKENKGFNVGQPQQGMEEVKTFDVKEVAIPVQCNVHPWMKGYIAVLPHPYFKVTGADGAFELDMLPPGNYTLKVWHELGQAQAQVTVEEKGTAEVELKVAGGAT